MMTFGQQENGSVNVNFSGATDTIPNSTLIDESFYSRQIYVLGNDAMTRMANSKVLVSGIGGLGVEVAKNVILGGVKSVTLQDTKVAEWRDLSSQYYITEADIGSNRATISLNHLCNLNPHVTVEVSTDPLTTDEISKYNVLVLTEYESIDQLLEISDFCHTGHIALILAQTNGVFGRVFCDFGEDFRVLDPNGKEPLSALVGSITKENQATVTCLDGFKHGFNVGDFVRFTEVTGMTQINGLDFVEITGTGPDTFRLDWDTSEFGEYVRNGIATQVILPKQVVFKSLREAMQDPDGLLTDSDKDDHPYTIHAAYAALDEFLKEHGRLPAPWDGRDKDLLIKLSEKFKPEDAELKTDLLQIFSFVCSGNLAPVNGFIGGVVAQELMKACTGKFYPIKQWLYFDAIECLPDPLPSTVERNSDYISEGNRYQGQIAVFGKAFQDKLLKQRWFIAGAGAIGCELLKNFAMMGLGNIIITDMDLIERSNLNRQFLFRQENIGQNKAVTAKAAVGRMNPGIKVEAHENLVGPETESVYDDPFFESLNGVANALDNVEGRIYVDRRCRDFRKPFLDSGTGGADGSMLPVIPFVTQSYFSSFKSEAPPKKEIPDSSLKFFPNAIEHTLEWARDQFDGLFRQPIENAASFLKDTSFLEKDFRLPALNTLESLYKTLVAERPANMDDCVKWARLLWEDNFGSGIKQLLHNFPQDTKTTTGNLFWQSPKRLPHPLAFDLEDNLAVDFVYTAANLRADVYHIPRASREKVKEISAVISVPEFVPIPKSGVRIATSDAEAQNVVNQGSLDQSRVDELVDLIRAVDFTGIKVNPLEFEKDNDENLHIDFIMACSNSRASNYSIEHADRLKSKLIAGKIMPAIATTSSVVTGLVGLELYKIVQGHSNIEKYKRGYVELAVPRFTFYTPDACSEDKYHEVYWNRRNGLNVEGEMTLQEFFDFFAKEHQLEVTWMLQGGFILYGSPVTPDDRKERLALPVTEVVRRVTGRNIDPHVKALVFELRCKDKDGVAVVETRYVRYVIPQSQRQLQ